MITGTESAVHVIALVKGAVEGDPHKHFGSLLGFSRHLGAAAAAGLVTTDGDPTDRGVDFYRRHQLAKLPAGRANYWAAAAVASAAAELAPASRPDHSQPHQAERDHGTAQSVEKY